MRRTRIDILRVACVSFALEKGAKRARKDGKVWKEIQK
jgi:hypothetical protein